MNKNTENLQDVFDDIVTYKNEIDKKNTKKRSYTNYDKDKTLFIYTRVSTKVQEETGTSLETQKSTGIRLSERLNFDYLHFDEKGKSSNYEEIHKREILFELYELIRKNKVKHLFVYDMSRLSRTREVSFLINSELIKHKVKLYTSNGEYDFDSIEDKLMYDVLSVISRYDNEVRRIRSITGKIHRLKNNQHSGGLVNYGYFVENKQLKVVSEESKHIKKMFKMYDENYSTKDIQNYLIRENVKTRRGNSVFSQEQIINMLKNEIYIGRRKTVIDNQEFHTTNQSIVNRDIFNRVQNKIEVSLQRRNQLNKTKHFYLLTKYLRCKDCNNILCGRKTFRNKKLSENYYYCSQSMYRYKNTKKVRNQKKCSMIKSINMMNTDKLVYDSLIDVIEHSYLLKETQKDKFLTIKKDSDKTVQQQIQTVKRKIDKLDKEKVQLYDNVYEVKKELYTLKINKNQYDELVGNIESVIEEKNQKIKELQSDILDLSNEKVFIDWLNKYRKDVDKLRDVTDEKKQQKHLDKFVDTIYVSYDSDNKEHILDIQFKLKMFNDKLIYNDVNDKSKGYKIIDGEDIKTVTIDSTKRGKYKVKKKVI